MVTLTNYVMAGGLMLVAASLVHAESRKTPAALGFKMKSLRGKEVDLGKYKGKVVMIVNVASECGLTPQYKQLQALHDKYAKQGLAILGFPCNQFGRQEPGSATQIREFCSSNYGVEFDMFAKISVKGGAQAPLYAYLTSDKITAADPGPVKWNFEKFLVDGSGKVIGRFRSSSTPQQLIPHIEKALADPPPSP